MSDDLYRRVDHPCANPDRMPVTRSEANNYLGEYGPPCLAFPGDRDCDGCNGDGTWGEFIETVPLMLVPPGVPGPFPPMLVPPGALGPFVSRYPEPPSPPPSVSIDYMAMDHEGMQVVMTDGSKLYGEEAHEAIVATGMTVIDTADGNNDLRGERDLLDETVRFVRLALAVEKDYREGCCEGLTVERAWGNVDAALAALDEWRAGRG